MTLHRPKPMSHKVGIHKGKPYAKGGKVRKK